LVVYTSDNGPWNLKGNATDKVKGNMNRSIGGSADPLRGYKFSHWEGGMRVPCILRWPGKIPADKTCDEVLATIDLLPTFAAFAGSPLPTKKIDGLSMAAVLTGEAGAQSPHAAYFYRTNGVRSGQWKLVDGQLFDLQADISESTDLAKTHPEKVLELKALLEQHKTEMRAESRAAANHQREPYPLSGAIAWTIMSGRWAFNQKKGVEQQADWCDARLLWKAGAAPLCEVAVDARRGAGQGSLNLGLSALNGSQIEFSIGPDNIAVITFKINDVQQTQFRKTLKESLSNQWHTLSLRVEQQTVVAFIDRKRIAKFELDAIPVLKQVSLGSSLSKVEFRNLKAFSCDRRLVLQSFLANE
jgi:hypothetical protein